MRALPPGLPPKGVSFVTLQGWSWAGHRSAAASHGHRGGRLKLAGCRGWHRSALHPQVAGSTHCEKKFCRLATLRTVGVLNKPQNSLWLCRSVLKGPHKPMSYQSGALSAGMLRLRGTPNATEPKSVKAGNGPRLIPLGALRAIALVGVVEHGQAALFHFGQLGLPTQVGILFGGVRCEVLWA